MKLKLVDMDKVKKKRANPQSDEGRLYKNGRLVLSAGLQNRRGIRELMNVEIFISKDRKTLALHFSERPSESSYLSTDNKGSKLIELRGPLAEFGLQVSISSPETIPMEWDEDQKSFFFNLEPVVKAYAPPVNSGRFGQRKK